MAIETGKPPSGSPLPIRRHVPRMFGLFPESRIAVFFGLFGLDAAREWRLIMPVEHAGGMVVRSHPEAETVTLPAQPVERVG